MTNLRPEICFRLRDARRGAGISQQTLAAEIGCHQSALSMFEKGDGTKLNADSVGKFAKKFSVDLNGGTQEAPKIEISSPHTGFCPNPSCPSNRAYEVDGRRLYLPDRESADPAGGRFCAMCGEVLERRCATCGASVHAGAVCTHCGQPYVAG